ncbi:MAG TPA: pyridoxal-phosphate dependent enzyme [Gemmatimonadaceae bacterium]|nr:pyridoxal-phosphate dependent enzyme [Gemmatimonadaceae bacterium]
MLPPSSPEARPLPVSPATLPIVARFPALAGVPRVAIGRFPTPVEPLAALAPNLWIKRDDLAADPMGGNKARALEWLLAGTAPGDRVVTVGSAGSTHALAVATYASRLGAHASIGRWRQEMNGAAAEVSHRIAQVAERAPIHRTPVGAYVWAWAQRGRGARWIAAGGTTPLGILGHVNGGLELAEQVARGELPAPRAAIVPLGTGGTAAGLSLAFAIAGIDTRVVGARVVPKIVGRRRRVVRLANRAAALLERLSGTRVPRVSEHSIEVVDHTFGGAYGRETSAGRDAARRLLAETGIALDTTYSAKAFALALERAALAAPEPVLFWLTFDSRILGERTP